MKVKITGWRPTDVVTLCERLHEVRPQLRLRLDANQSWHPEQIVDVMQHPASQCISYWEEPTPPSQLMKVAAAGVPIALDESLRAADCDDALLQASVAWIWKPTLSGSIEHLWGVRHRARALEKPLVLSSCFEGAHTVGLFMELSDPHVVHGLDPYHFHGPDGPLYPSGSCLHWKPTSRRS